MTEVLHTHASANRAMLAEMESEAAQDESVYPGSVSPGALPTLPVANQSADFSSFKTVVLTANNVYKPLLPDDPYRRRVVVVAIDNPVVLCDSLAQAQDAANQVTNVPNPQGGYLPVNVPVVLSSKQASWAAVTTTASNSRVFVAIERDEQ